MPIFVYGPNGRVQTQALVDGGSNATLIQQDLAEELGLSGPQSKLVLGGANMDGVVDSFELKDRAVSNNDSVPINPKWCMDYNSFTPQSKTQITTSELEFLLEV